MFRFEQVVPEINAFNQINTLQFYKASASVEIKNSLKGTYFWEKKYVEYICSNPKYGLRVPGFIKIRLAVKM